MTDRVESSSRPRNRSQENTFASLQIDRAARRRRYPSWIAGRLEAPGARFLLFWGSKVLMTPDPAPSPAWLSPEEAESHLRRAESVILLGETGEHTIFVIGLDAADESPPPSLKEMGAFRRLRAVAALLDGETASLLAYAKGMIHYHHEHRFCPACGSPTRAEEGGHLRVCTDPECGRQDFPRTDPAIIVLVSSGDRCLLGRQPTWPEHLYSIIAGFVEPGESLEAAAAREVREETGIRIRRVRYQSSQPWPFPRSLMIGFTAAAETTTIRLRDGELEEAQWLSREEIVAQVREGALQLPSAISISRRLIEAWFDVGQSAPLREVLDSA